ncbi:MAG TPA: hypothetical protein VGB94_00925 [Acidobacteriaceae bacterium]
MSIAISGSYSSQTTVDQLFVSTAKQAVPEESAQAEGDTVKLSEAAQVSQLSKQGSSPALIAQTLGIPVATVNLDLGITTTESVSVASVAQAVMAAASKGA